MPDLDQRPITRAIILTIPIALAVGLAFAFSTETSIPGRIGGAIGQALAILFIPCFFAGAAWLVQRLLRRRNVAALQWIYYSSFTVFLALAVYGQFAGEDYPAESHPDRHQRRRSAMAAYRFPSRSVGLAIDFPGEPSKKTTGMVKGVGDVKVSVESASLKRTGITLAADFAIAPQKIERQSMADGGTMLEEIARNLGLTLKYWTIDDYEFGQILRLHGVRGEGNQKVFMEVWNVHHEKEVLTLYFLAPPADQGSSIRRGFFESLSLDGKALDVSRSL